MAWPLAMPQLPGLGRQIAKELARAASDTIKADKNEPATPATVPELTAFDAVSASPETEVTGTADFPGFTASPLPASYVIANTD